MSEPATRIQVRAERSGFRLDVDAGWDERVAVVFGPSGSGKTTLFHAVLGLLPGAEARIRLGGIWLDDAPHGVRVPVERRGLGWVPQDATLFPHLSVAGNLRFGIGRGIAGADGERALSRAVEVLELEGLLERRVDQLSGGERQRVAIGRALASGPRALLMDEPLASLDLPLRARVLPHLLRVRDELDLPILYITHDPDEAMLVGEVCLVLESGRVLASGPPRSVLWSQAVLPLSEALGIENVLEARVAESGATESTLETPGGLRLVIPIALPVGERVRAGIPASDLILALEPPGRVSARNVFEARVASLDAQEGDARVHLDAGAHHAERLVAKLTPTAVEKLGLRPGVPIRVLIKAQAIRRLA